MNAETPIADLIEIAPKDALAMFTTDDPAAAMAPIVEKVRAVVGEWENPGIDTPAARKEVASMAYRITRARGAVEKIGKELAAEAKKVPGKIDATRRYIEKTFDAMRDEIRAPLTAWEEAEAARIDWHGRNLAALEAKCKPDGRTLDELRADLNTVNGIPLDDTREEFLAEYVLLVEKARTFLTGAIAAREKADAEAAELAELRREKAERERIERENDIAAEAARNAEKRAREEAAERERQLIAEKEAAERRAVEAAAKVKADIEAQKRSEEAARAQREANSAHIRKVNRAAVAALVAAGLGEESAKAAIRLIAKGGVPNVSISY